MNTPSDQKVRDHEFAVVDRHHAVIHWDNRLDCWLVQRGDWWLSHCGGWKHRSQAAQFEMFREAWHAMIAVLARMDRESNVDPGDHWEDPRDD